MSSSNFNRLSFIVLGGALLTVVSLQGCSSDEQAAPMTAGSSSGGRAGSAAGGRAGTPGTAGTATGGTGDEAGAAGAATVEGGSGGEAGGGDGPGMCENSFDNNTLTAITDNGGELPPLP